MHTLATVTLLCLMISASYAQDCGAGLESCAGQCYSTGQASCVTSNTGAIVLCGFQHLPDTTPDAACGTTCYDTATYGCCAATSTIYTLGDTTNTNCDVVSTPSPTSPPVGATNPSDDCGCGTGLECCAGQCYSTGEASCVTSNNGSTVLCGFQHLPALTPDAACGVSCYDTATYGCCDSTNTIFTLGDGTCPDSATMPTSSPSTTSAPVGGSAPSSTNDDCGCGAGLSCCAGQCYSTGEASCVTSNNGSTVLCGFQHLPLTTPDAACGVSCYDTATYGCCDSTNTIFTLGDGTCPDSATMPTSSPSTTSAPVGGSAPSTNDDCGCGTGLACCAGQCYSTGQASCVTSNNGSTVLCGFQHLPDTTPDMACGVACYDTADFGCCDSTNSIYSLDEPSQCPDNSVAPTQSSTSPAQSFTAPPTNAPATDAPTTQPPSGAACGNTFCGAGLDCCAGQCYSTAQASCVTSNNGSIVLCGFQHLPDTTPDKACGVACYDTIGFGCCASNSQIYNLATPQDCPSLTQCGSTFCDAGLSCCGSSCFDSSSAVCIRNANQQQIVCNANDSACIAQNGAGRMAMSAVVIIVPVVLAMLF